MKRYALTQVNVTIFILGTVPSSPNVLVSIEVEPRVPRLHLLGKHRKREIFVEAESVFICICVCICLLFLSVFLSVFEYISHGGCT